MAKPSRPLPNGCFLNGITRQRIISLLTGAGIKVHECSLNWQDLLDADEVFSTGNYSKVTPVTTIEQRTLQPGPIAAKARELYWAYAHRSSFLRPGGASFTWSCM